MKIWPADKWVGYCVKERNEWTCEFCGKQYPQGSQGIHCAHFETRGTWSTRFDPINLFALCFYHHQQMDGSPHRFVEFYKTKRGADMYDLLVERIRDTALGKRMRHEKDEIAAHYLEEHEHMLLMRSMGQVGWMEFTAYE